MLNTSINSWTTCIRASQHLRRPVTDQLTDKDNGLISLSSFSALTLLDGWQEGHPACKRPMPIIPNGSLFNTATHLMALYPGQPGWASSRRNIHPPTLHPCGHHTTSLTKPSPSSTVHSTPCTYPLGPTTLLHDPTPSPPWPAFSSHTLHPKSKPRGMNQAMGYASQHILCLYQARINWEGCGRKGIWHKDWGDDGSGGNGDRMSWHPVGSSVQVPSRVVPRSN